MKKLFIIIITIFIGHIANAQQYVSFPDSNAVWSESHTYSSTGSTYYYRNILKNIDTIVNNKTYHQLFYSLIDTLYNSINTSSSYNGAIREANKQVFYLPKNYTQEYLMYDFSKNIGEVFKYDYAIFQVCDYIGPDSLVLTSIDSVIINNGTYRKRYKLADTDGFPSFCYWIEGIGNEGGLLAPLRYIPIGDGCGNGLICFKSNEEVIYLNQFSNKCFPFNTAINENIKQNNRFEIFPNPASIKTKIKYPQLFGEGELHIYNTLGQLVYEEKLAKASSQKELNIHNFKTGLYKVIIREKGIIKGQVSLIKN